MTDILNKQVITLNPHEVRDETLAVLEDELRRQADQDIEDIKIMQTIVIDANTDGGLDSHATIFTTPSTEVNANE